MDYRVKVIAMEKNGPRTKWDEVFDNLRKEPDDIMYILMPEINTVKKYARLKSLYGSAYAAVRTRKLASVKVHLYSGWPVLSKGIPNR